MARAIEMPPVLIEVAPTGRFYCWRNLGEREVSGVTVGTASRRASRPSPLWADGGEGTAGHRLLCWKWPSALGASMHYGGRRDAGATEFWVDRHSFRNLEYRVELRDPQQFAHRRSWIEKLKINTRGLQRDQN